MPSRVTAEILGVFRGNLTSQTSEKVNATSVDASNDILQVSSTTSTVDSTRTETLSYWLQLLEVFDHTHSGSRWQSTAES